MYCGLLLPLGVAKQKLRKKAIKNAYKKWINGPCGEILSSTTVSEVKNKLFLLTFKAYMDKTGNL